MCRKPSDVIPDDPILAALSRDVSHRGRRDVPTWGALDPLAEPRRTKKAEPRRARFLPRHVRGLLASAASVGALLLIAPSVAGAVPVNTSLPVINGTLELGQTLSAATGTWSDKSPIVAYEYQWLFCVDVECTDIAYATGSTYKIPWDLVGLQVEVAVFATDAEGETRVAASAESFDITYKGPYYGVTEGTVGNGSVTGFVSGFLVGLGADANLTCPIACGSLYRYAPGTNIELMATPQIGQSFLGWSGACSGSASTCFLTMNGNENITANFTGHPATPPALPPGTQDEPGEVQPAMGSSTPVPEARENGASPTPAANLPARILGVHALRDQIQAVVKCQEKKSCRLSLAFFAGTPTGHALIGQRSFTIAARRSAHISLTLNRTGERLLAKRHRLPVVAQLSRNTNGRSTFVELGHYTLTA